MILHEMPPPGPNKTFSTNIFSGRAELILFVNLTHKQGFIWKHEGQSLLTLMDKDKFSASPCTEQEKK